MLTFVMIISLIPINIFANIQNPPIDLWANVTNKESGPSTVIPDVLIGWTEPEVAPNDDGEQGDGNDPPTLPDGSHSVTNYFITTEDIAGPIEDQELLISKEASQQDISLLLQSGVFYKLNLVARHLHTREDPTNPDIKYDTIIESEPAVTQIVTDFDTQLLGTDEGLQVEFEYIPGINYKIGYTQGAADEVADFPENSDIIIKESDLGPDNRFTDANNGREYVRYVLSEGIAQGQMYSVYVMPDFDEWDPNKQITTIGKDPKIVSAITSIPLKVFNIGNGKIRLEWSISPNILENSYALTKTSIYAQVAGQNPQEIFTFEGTNGTIGYYELYEPTSTTVYWIEFEFTKEGDVLSPLPATGKVEYIPYDMPAAPAAPQIPQPFSDKVDLTANNAKDYLVKNDDTPYHVEYFKEQTFTVIENMPVIIQLVWDSYTKTNADGIKSTDFDIVYDIWVTERKESLDSSLVDNGLAPIYRNIDINAEDDDTLVKSLYGDIVGFKTTISQYYDVTEKLMPFVTNKTYFIQMVAKKRNGVQYSVSEPTIVAITIDKNGDIFSPPILGKPPIKIKEESLTKNEVDIIWLEQWQEIMYKDTANADTFYEKYPDNIALSKQWNSKVFIGEDDPKIYFRAPLDEDTFVVDLISEKHLELVKDSVGINFYERNFLDRHVILGNNIDYEIKTQKYEDVKELQGGLTLEEWILKMSQSNDDPNWNAGWENVNITNYQDPIEDDLIWKEHKIEGLEANTAYITFIRAFRVLDDGTKLMQTYPSFIIYNTLSDFEGKEEIPIVPNLNLQEVSDTSIEVFFKYNHKFDYEIVYSRLDDPDKASFYKFELSSNPESDFYVGDGENAYIELLGLFPDTEYYIWVRAKQKEGELMSAWSSPVFAKTEEIQPPDPPTSLGPASKLNLIEVGYEDEPITDKYITVQWELDENDIPESETEGNLSKTYYYVVEFADNIEFIESTVVTVTEEDVDGGGDPEAPFEILAKNLVRFNNLKTNTDYYVKVKTGLTIVDDETERELTKESDFTKWVRIKTLSSKGEYTGEPDNVTDFEVDFEEEFEEGIWDYEIVNPEGLITQILDKNLAKFEIDLSLYDDRIDPRIRKLTMPISLVQALDNRAMELEVITSDAIYSINSSVINTNNLRSTDKAVFTFTDVTNYDLGLAKQDYPYKFQSAEQTGIYVITGTRVPQPINVLSNDMEVKFKINENEQDNLIPQVYNTSQSKWEILSSERLDTEDGSYIVYGTNVVGINALYSTQNLGLDRDMTDSIKNIADRFGITQLGTMYYGNTPVKAEQFTNLILGMVYNNQVIDLDKPVSTSEQSLMQNSGLFTGVPNSTLTNEQAISSLVKLYELKNGYPISAMQVEFSDTSPEYQEGLAKAYSLGIITENEFDGELKAKGNATYDYICDILLNLGL
ncbi:hypothetical protein AN641_05310 [Candidatus Epulonipiscioides gigas]|nr:hypothetical protein AN641_05310 [Epulopiscium sp. SCG-C07WGA-EpuloA2]